MALSVKASFKTIVYVLKTAINIKWYAKSRIKDDVMRHPTDCLAWKCIDFQYPEFAKDPQNVRLALAPNRFNPIKNMSVAHITCLLF